MRQDTDHTESNEYFDPPAPEIPAEVLGVPTKPLRDLGRALGTLAFIDTRKTPTRLLTFGLHAKYSADDALALFPLIERLQLKDEFRSEEVRPYLKPIKRLVPTLKRADNAAIIGFPLRKVLNRKIQEGFSDRITPKLEKAVDYLPIVEPYTNFVAQFENPREQFISEVSLVANGIRRLARYNAETRGTYPDAVTARDAGEGIGQAIERVVTQREIAREHLPLLSYFAFDNMPDDAKIPSSDMLAIVAPEIMRGLDAALPVDQTDPDFLKSISNYPHPKRGLAQLFKRRQLDHLDDAARLLLPSIRDLLPTDGHAVSRTFDRLKKFFKK